MDGHCRACRAGLDHCHGTLVEHVLRVAECTEDGCVHTERVRHLLVLDCEAVGCRCAQVYAPAI